MKKARALLNSTPPTMHGDGQGFDVVATIGQVRFGSGDESAVVAAMRIIGEHNREGVYRFPHEDGGEWVVSMEHTGVINQEAEDGGY